MNLYRNPKEAIDATKNWSIGNWIVAILLFLAGAVFIAVLKFFAYID